MTRVEFQEFVDLVACATRYHGKLTIPTGQKRRAREILKRIVFNELWICWVHGGLVEALDPTVHTNPFYDVYERRIGPPPYERFPTLEFLTNGVDGLSDETVAFLLFNSEDIRRAQELIADAVRNNELSPVWREVMESLSADQIELIEEGCYRVLK